MMDLPKNRQQRTPAKPKKIEFLEGNEQKDHYKGSNRSYGDKDHLYVKHSKGHDDIRNEDYWYA